MPAPSDESFGSGMISKWSVKPADHKAVRIRNNQRRHRERVKNHTATLEARLEETQLQLEKALARVAELTEELRLAKALIPVETISPMALNRSGTAGVICVARKDESAFIAEADCPPTQEADGLFAVRNSPSCVLNKGDKSLLQPELPTQKTIHTDGELPRLFSPVLSSPPAEQDITPQGLAVGYDEVVAGGEQDYDSLPPPNPDESTTRCRDAFTIIMMQNYSGLDLSAIRRRLQPGFRGSSASGDGCRVDNKLLFALLDAISNA
ncbi:uncharacterized protein DNG_06796 [Cephalotrichum gorgonifer]|uniref:BZIP domain-containing protein n=1 Tax=Cephalotrichum gorgonifer TaxID=2041049 RepID=A0AAE8N2B0_9PEZI|nr:uncharacterized protein DNG_06796 [Cephalotrichum gorgonifer]